MCSNICETNFIPLYNKIDQFSLFTLNQLNHSLEDVNRELNIIINECSIIIINKLNDKLSKISQSHARLDANYRVLTELLTSYENGYENSYDSYDKIDNIKYVGFKQNEFMLIIMLFLIIGYCVEYIRNYK
jgi:hypothetical protein